LKQQKKRAIRKFTGGLISKEDLEKIVDAARLAPSGSSKLNPGNFNLYFNLFSDF
jgi:nitroreductase